jgi:hypothetical protein
MTLEMEDHAQLYLRESSSRSPAVQNHAQVRHRALSPEKVLPPGIVMASGILRASTIAKSSFVFILKELSTLHQNNKTLNRCVPESP